MSCSLTSTLNLQLALMVLAVMTLAINGGAVLPLAATFASTNLVSATILMAVVAMANVYTSDILLWQALSCKKRDFETLADAVAGPLWKVRRKWSLLGFRRHALPQ